MARGLSGHVYFDKKRLLVVVVPRLRPDGLYYEVNIKSYPRFFMKWTELGRYDIAEPDSSIPYDLILAVNEILEAETHKS